MKLVVLCKELRYAGKPYARDAVFEASEKDAKILKAVRKAADAPPVEPVRLIASTQPLAPSTFQIQADSDVVVFDADPAPLVRPYRTRRMKAEG